MPTLAGYSEACRSSDLAACRALLRGGSRSFYTASFLLPSRVREPATALYAFCRLADDAIDCGNRGEDAVAEWEERLEAAYRGMIADHPADRAFADVVARFHIPKELPQALIEGFAWDKAGRTYETIEDVLDYAARVAGSVGAMMSLLMQRSDPETVARACELGMAMQLTNIARDVGEDARAGRLYLPRAWLREAGLEPEDWLATPSAHRAIAAATQRLLSVADQLYSRADCGIARLPKDCRAGIGAARLLYSHIGTCVAEAEWNSVDRRAVVPASRKAALFFRALSKSSETRDMTSNDAHRAIKFLVAAVGLRPAEDRVSGARELLAWWDLKARFISILELFERLERRERDLRSPPAPA